MNISKLISYIPDSVKLDIIDFTDVRTKDGRKATRVLIDRIVTDEEKAQLEKSKHITGVYTVTYGYAPEIKKSFFYVD